MRRNKRLKIWDTIGNHIVNNMQETPKAEVSNYMDNFIEKFKNTENIDRITLVKTSIFQNLTLAIIIWLAGTTVIGVPVVLTVILFRGMCLGYTISAIAYTLGSLKGSLFCIISLLSQNILFIPAILSLGVSSLKLYKSIIKDRRKENIKIEIIRHTLFSFLMLCLLVLSSLIENLFSINLLQNMIKFF